ncbi:MAG TPA: hypothetical protein VLG16_01885 [Candidatus Saccharimonadales bacterium]|nr:hypothetical protein [Candidatus Saccharimonadales bacterium]
MVGFEEAAFEDSEDIYAEKRRLAAEMIARIEAVTDMDALVWMGEEGGLQIAQVYSEQEGDSAFFLRHGGEADILGYTKEEILAFIGASQGGRVR